MLCVAMLIAALTGWSGAATAEESPEEDAPTETAELAETAQTGEPRRLADDFVLPADVVPDPAAIAVLARWRALRAGDGDWDDYVGFLAEHPGWPGLDRLRVAGEAKLGDAPADVVLAYFSEAPPATGRGALSLAVALDAAGQSDAAMEALRAAWRDLPLSSAEEEAFLALPEEVLREADHAARLDTRLWETDWERAERLLELVPGPVAEAAGVRRALREGDADAEERLEALPATVSGGAGLAYERFLWLDTRDQDGAALRLLVERSQSAESLGRPAAWAWHRRAYARRLMWAGEAALAYRVAANHHLGEGADFADLEWLAGYLALRDLGQPDTALAHFQSLRGSVETPISRGRAWYWEGRAHEAAGNALAAFAAHAAGAAYQTSFYGLLAAEHAGLPRDPALAGADPLPDWRSAGFRDEPLFGAALYLLADGQDGSALWFLAALARQLSGPEAEALAGFAIEVGGPRLAVRVGKALAAGGAVVPAAYYPLHPLADGLGADEAALALAVARRESEFDPGAVSGVGARGLMQVMPATAEAVARDLDLAFRETLLTEDWAYNAALGVEYLRDLKGRFGASPVLVAAGYNAGPGRPAGWIAEFGDPRDEALDVVDWIERIPFAETRNYVMRVTEALPAYRARLAGAVDSRSFMQDLRGAYPLRRPQPRPAALGAPATARPSAKDPEVTLGTEPAGPAQGPPRVLPSPRPEGLSSGSAAE